MSDDTDGDMKGPDQAKSKGTGDRGESSSLTKVQDLTKADDEGFDPTRVKNDGQMSQCGIGEDIA